MLISVDLFLMAYGSIFDTSAYNLPIAYYYSNHWY